MSAKVFVSFGTHEQPFTRLMDMLVELSEKRAVSIMIQSGYTQVPKALLNSKNETVMPHNQYLEAVRDCDVFITQSSPGNIFGALELQKLPIIVPRLHEFGEHVDSHQTFFGLYAHTCGWALLAEDSSELMGRFDELQIMGRQGQSLTTEKFLVASHARTQLFVNQFSSFVEESFNE